MFKVGRNLTRVMQAVMTPLQSLRHGLSSRLDRFDPEASPDNDLAPLSRTEMARRRRRDFKLARRERTKSSFGLFAIASLSWRRALAVCTLVGITAFSVSAIRADGYVRRWTAQQLPTAEAAAAAMGLGIDQISLDGHEFTYDADVFDALDLGNVRTFAAFDAKAAKDRIERLPWVATAELTRVYPNRLDIRITERKPYAVWTRGDKTFLVDVTGRVLAPVPAGSTPELPRIRGEGAPELAKAFLDLVDRYPALRTRVDSAERVGERRWTLHLKGKVELLLPASAEERALSEIMSDAKLAALTEASNITIDYRVRGRVAVNRAKENGASAPGT